MGLESEIRAIEESLRDVEGWKEVSPEAARRRGCFERRRRVACVLVRTRLDLGGHSQRRGAPISTEELLADAPVSFIYPSASGRDQDRARSEEEGVRDDERSSARPDLAGPLSSRIYDD